MISVFVYRVVGSGGDIPFIADDLAEAVEHAIVSFLTGSASALLQLTA